jgi:hypothetical protein
VLLVGLKRTARLKKKETPALRFVTPSGTSCASLGASLEKWRRLLLALHGHWLISVLAITKRPRPNHQIPVTAKENTLCVSPFWVESFFACAIRRLRPFNFTHCGSGRGVPKAAAGREGLSVFTVLARFPCFLLILAREEKRKKGKNAEKVASGKNHCLSPGGIAPSKSLPSLSLPFDFFGMKKKKESNLQLLTSDQTRLPAEFKHINKRRKRN